MILQKIFEKLKKIFCQKIFKNSKKLIHQKNFKIIWPKKILKNLFNQKNINTLFAGNTD